MSIPQEALLLLELLDLLLIGGLGNELVDIGEVPFSGDVESGVLFPNTISSP